MWSNAFALPRWEEGLDVFSDEVVEQSLLRLVTLALDGGSSPSGPGRGSG